MGTLCSRAISLMRSAIRRWPLATILGARMVSESYLSATARVVGLVITTSAVGTASIIRAKAIWRARRRRAPRICGLPSCSLYSCLTSSLVMRMDSMARRLWTTKSTRATTASRIVIVRPSWKTAFRQLPAMVPTSAPSVPTIEGMRLPTTCHEMKARMASLAEARPSRTRACLSAIRRNPVIGLMRLKSNRMAR